MIYTYVECTYYTGIYYLFIYSYDLIMSALTKIFPIKVKLNYYYYKFITNIHKHSKIP